MHSYSYRLILFILVAFTATACDDSSSDANRDASGPAYGTGGAAEGTVGDPKQRTGWPLSGFDVASTGFNSAEQQLGSNNITDLRVDWTFDSSVAGQPVRAIHATPVVDTSGNVYVGDFAGTFFAISSAGKLLWSFKTDPPTPELAALVAGETGSSSATPFLSAAALSSTRPYIVFGDANGRVYARNSETGAEIWTVRDLDTNPLGGLSGNALSIVDDTVLVGMSSLENYAFVLSQGGVRVDCCSHQGAIVALDLETGRVRWRHALVDTAQPLPAELAPFVLGPSGADVWSQPVYDADTQTIYVSTGQNLSPDATGKSTPASDAIVAVDARTGQSKWVHQLTAGDIWAVGVPNPDPQTGQQLDQDLGDSPKLYQLSSGRKVVGAGQKDGRYHVLDAETGALVSTTQVVPARSDLGGFQTGGAVAYGLAFQHGLSATAGFSDCKTGTCPYEGFNGVVVALEGDGSKTLWTFSRPASPLVGGLAVANQLVYVQSPVDEASPLVDQPIWGLYALDAKTGEVRKRLTFPGRAIGSPVVADGKLYATTGNLALTLYGTYPDGSVLCLSTPSLGTAN